MTDRDSGGRLSTTDRVYGAVAAIAIVLAVFFLFRGGGADATRVDRAPRITIEDPRPGADVDQPMVVTFNARTTLRPDGSDPAAGRHVHARIGATELMPGTADVQPAGGTRYRWTLPRLPAGAANVRLYWSDASHQPIPGAASDSVPVTIR
ncbi:hypothetical protein [Longimicrobium sp.]|uniref:hypothetical protein n=1 Tax=Longimicrobium sp. TaxID=2029185 RepID=UPI002CA07DDB|nr:hypothetical protein [Longimicrobium sp.]HSU17787.1 hypothetical protein [Longimicrobium sp.]